MLVNILIPFTGKVTLQYRHISVEGKGPRLVLKIQRGAGGGGGGGGVEGGGGGGGGGQAKCGVVYSLENEECGLWKTRSAL